MSATTNTPAQPPPIAKVKLRPTRFKAKLDGTSPSLKAPDVETEFQRYASDGVSSSDTDILRFWEVRSFQLNGAMT